MQQSIATMNERQLVIDIARNYVLAFKNTDPSLVEQHFHPDFHKTGFFFLYDQNKWDQLLTHGYDEVKAWTSSYNKEGIMPDTEPIVSILDINHKIAVVKIIAEWAPNVKGLDYVVLVKQDNEWIIRSVSWQTML